jgi:hypothetical protein
MQIDESCEQPWNAELPMRERLDPNSKVTVTRERQPQKHEAHILSTDEGMQIDESDEQF